MTEKFLGDLEKSSKKTRNYIGVFVLLIVLNIVIIYVLTQTSPSHSLPNVTVYVAGAGSGQFKCDGTDDQVEINQALEYATENSQFTTVHLKGPHTYVISDSIFIGNNTTLEGDPTAVIKLIDNADWVVGKPLITQMDKNESYNITIRGFEIDGNHDNNLDKPKGYGYYNMIHLRNCENIQVYDMYVHDGHGEMIKADNSSNIRFYNNRVYKTGHNSLFAENSENIEVWNNTVTIRTDSGFRMRNSNHIKIHDNKIDSFYHWSAGGAGILIEKTTGVVNDVEVYDNIIERTYGPGIWLIGTFQSYPKDDAKNVHIYHNVFRGTGTNPNIDWVGGIVTSGFYDTLVENNTFDAVYHGAIVEMYPTGGTHIYPTYENSGHIDLSPKDTGYTTIVRNNIIANTRQRSKDPAGTGYGVVNYLPETHTIILENNCLYNNYAGNYRNCTSSSDIYIDPLLLNQSIGAGYSEEDHPKNINQTVVNSIFRKRCF